VVIVKILNFGFFATFDRPFDPVGDWSYTEIGIETMRESIGGTGANLAIVGAVVLCVGVLVLMTLAVLRLTRVAAVHRRWSLQAVTALGVVWVLCWMFGAQLVSGTPVASASAAGLAVDEVRAVQAGLEDNAIFADEIIHDRFRNTPGDQLLTGLHGKDVILAFIESYGKVAVQDSSLAPRVDAVLDRGTKRLEAAGFSSRSAFLTSSTFGGARWRTVDDVPSNNRDWAQGKSFYRYDKIYDRRNVGYRGPRFAYASMPDQYVLAALQRLELSKRDRRPVFAEVDLVSSHAPWTRIPRLIDWDDVGDGSVFNRIPVDQVSKSELWSDPDRVRAAYGRSIEYTLNALFSFVQHYGDDDLVLVVLGDHQPWTIVSGQSPSHDVPISVIAHDPAVLDQIAGWGWEDGMRPSPQAPVWPMNAFRDRFLSAFGSQPATR
jgi:hypothetical protein